MFAAPEITHQAPSQSSTPGAARPWHERRSWQRYARDLLRYYSRSSRYRLYFLTGGKGPLAAVSHEVRTVFIRAQLPVPAGHLPIRGENALKEAPTRLWLEGLGSHEAGHIRYSGEKPQNLLGELWNALEDERMERCMAAAHPKLAADYTTMGDVMLDRYVGKRRAGNISTKLSAQVLDSALLWRWSHDHRQAPPLPLGDTFEEVRPIVEEAWEAESSDEVTALAREILEHFDLDPDAAAPDDRLVVGDLPSGPGAPGGAGDEGDADDLPDSPIEAPEAPAVDPKSVKARRAGNLLDGLHGAARRLASALQPEARRRLGIPHRSRGRFDYRRYARDQRRVFMRKPDAPQPPAFITVVLDASGSMIERTQRSTRWHVACQAAALITRAAELASTQVQVIPFQRRPLPALRSREIGHERIRVELAGQLPDDRTALAPALRAATSARAATAGRGRHVLVVISDGQLTPDDTRASTDVLRRARGGPGRAAWLPILIGEADPRPYETIFRRVCPLGDPDELPAVCERWLRHAV